MVFLIGYLAPWFAKITAQASTIRRDYVDTISIRTAIDQIALALAGTPHSSFPSGGPAAWLAVPLLAVLLAWLGWRGGWRGRFLALTGALPVLVMVALSIGSNRSFLSAKHLVFCQPLWLSGIAVLVASIRAPLERAAAAWALALSVLAVYAAWNVIGPDAKPGMRAAVRTILERRKPDEPVVTNNPFMFFGLRRYARGRAEPRLLAAVPSRRALRGSEHLWDEQLSWRSSTPTACRRRAGSPP